MAKTERPLPDFVQQEFEAYLKCGRLEHGLCPSCGAKRMVEHAALLVDKILPEEPYRQWVLSVPFQLRFLDGAYVSNKANKLAFKQVNAPTKDQLQTVVQRISERLAKLLIRQVDKVGGFSLHAAVATQAHERKKLERIDLGATPQAGLQH
jgi:hypothetical protein